MIKGDTLNHNKDARTADSLNWDYSYIYNCNYSSRTILIAHRLCKEYKKPYQASLEIAAVYSQAVSHYAVSRIRTPRRGIDGL